MWYALRWMLVPLAAILGFCASVVLSEPLTLWIHHLLWSNGRPMAGKDFLLYTLPWDGALAATLVIQFGTWTAPSHRRWVALVLLIVGGIVAWLLVGGDFELPEKSMHPIHTSMPIVGTYTAGVLNLALLWLIFRKNAN